MTLSAAIFVAIGFVIVTAHFVEWRIRRALEKHADLMDMQLRSILDAHYERLAVLILGELDGRR